MTVATCQPSARSLTCTASTERPRPSVASRRRSRPSRQHPKRQPTYHNTNADEGPSQSDSRAQTEAQTDGICILARSPPRQRRGSYLPRLIYFATTDTEKAIMPKLPAKREAAAAAAGPDAKKSKADAATASKARAREWAETRKKKKACTASEDRTADEKNDVVADLPLLSAPAAKKSSRRRGQSKVGPTSNLPSRPNSAFKYRDTDSHVCNCLISGGSVRPRSGSRE